MHSRPDADPLGLRWHAVVEHGEHVVARWHDCPAGRHLECAHCDGVAIPLGIAFTHRSGARRDGQAHITLVVLLVVRREARHDEGA